MTACGSDWLDKVPCMFQDRATWVEGRRMGGISIFHLLIVAAPLGAVGYAIWSLVKYLSKAKPGTRPTPRDTD